MFKGCRQPRIRSKSELVVVARDASRRVRQLEASCHHWSSRVETLQLDSQRLQAEVDFLKGENASLRVQLCSAGIVDAPALAVFEDEAPVDENGREYLRFSRSSFSSESVAAEVVPDPTKESTSRQFSESTKKLFSIAQEVAAQSPLHQEEEKEKNDTPEFGDENAAPVERPKLKAPNRQPLAVISEGKNKSTKQHSFKSFKMMWSKVPKPTPAAESACYDSSDAEMEATPTISTARASSAAGADECQTRPQPQSQPTSVNGCANDTAIDGSVADDVLTPALESHVSPRLLMTSPPPPVPAPAPVPAAAAAPPPPAAAPAAAAVQIIARWSSWSPQARVMCIGMRHSAA